MGAVITGIARTPQGKFAGAFKPLRAVQLGSVAMRGAIDRSSITPDRVDEVIFGQVLLAGEGQITPRQAAAQAGVPMTVPSTLVNKVCLSGMATIAMADRSIRLGESTFVLAGGMESMTNTPFIAPNVRWGARMGDTKLVDAMLQDGLWCSFDHCIMGEQGARDKPRGAGRVGGGKPPAGSGSGRLGSVRRRDRSGRGTSAQGRSDHRLRG